MSKRLILAGDSWSQGTWGTNDANEYGAIHNVYQAMFLARQYAVYNAGYGGICNGSAITRIQNLLHKLKLNKKQVDLIVWFQTEPLRALRKDNDESSLADLIGFQINNLRESYNRLNAFGLPVFCLGGCSKLKLDIMVEFENLIPVSEFLLGELTCNTAPWIYINSDVAENFSKDLILSDEYYVLLKMIDWKDKFVDIYTDAFTKDPHPNEETCHVIFERIIKAIKQSDK